MGLKTAQLYLICKFDKKTLKFSIIFVIFALNNSKKFNFALKFNYENYCRKI